MPPCAVHIYSLEQVGGRHSVLCLKPAPGILQGEPVDSVVGKGVSRSGDVEEENTVAGSLRHCLARGGSNWERNSKPMPLQPV
jgi:hypothetical protein